MNNKKVVHILVFISFLFLCLIGYLTAIEVYYKDEYAQSTYNQRNVAQENKILRGSIYDRNSQKLAYSEIEDDGTQVRYYPYKNLYSHVIGYTSQQYGKSLIEKVANADLLGKNNLGGIFNLNSIKDGKMTRGDDVHLTIDHNLQKRTDQLMAKYTGSACAINPKTGEVLAMVSKPDFDPSADALKNNWAVLNLSENSPFLTRATMGLYAPGSTYKVITTALLYENDMEDEIIDDLTGKAEFYDKSIQNAGGKIYGKTDLEQAFKVSSNVYFSTLGSHLEDKLLKNISKRFMFNSKLDFDLPYSKSKFQTSSMSEMDCAVASIGQGKTLTTPIHLALIASAIANDGKMMKPYIIDSVTDENSKVISRTKPELLSQPIDSLIAKNIKNHMLETVNSGTGTLARIYGIDICGKTGTSENELTIEDDRKTHAVFIGFAPMDDPEIAVSVVLEYAGGGGTHAAPIAREMIRTYLADLD